MKRATNNKYSNLGFGLAILVIVGAGVYATINLRTLITGNEMVSHTLIVEAKIDETLALLTDTETGQRGFIITGEEKYLEPYNLALAPDGGISQHLQELRQLTSDNPNQQKRLDLLESLAV